MEWVAERLLDRIDRSAQGIESPLAALEAIFMTHVEFVAEHSGVPRVFAIYRRGDGQKMRKDSNMRSRK